MAQPNIILLLTDDQGYGDAGCYGADDLETPNFDRLAAEGCRFTQWYGGAPICSASRAALLTGRFPWQVNVPGNVSPDWDARGLATGAPTLPERLREAGYGTYMSGKWHLGQAPGERPHERGFDSWFGFLYGCIDYYSHVFYWLMAGSKHAPRHDLWRDGVEIYDNGAYFTDLVADNAVAYLRRAAEEGRPFFLYVPFNNPHYPMQAPLEAVERFAGLADDRKWTAALLYTWDLALGRILDEVDALGLADDTLVWSSSDHGPSREARNWPDGRADEVYRGGSSGGLRGAKASVFEGGIRLPSAMRWPGVVRPGSVCDAVCHHTDMLPTLLGATGGEAPPDLVGGDLRPLLAGEAEQVERSGDLRWRMGRQRAVRRGPWKLVENVADPDPRDGEGEEGVRLYNLEDDPAERHDRSRDQPQTVAALSPGLAD